MSFATPAWLFLLPLVPLLLIVLAIAGWWHRRAVGSVFGPEMFERVIPRSVRVRRTLRDVGVLVGLTSAIVALAEPRFDKVVQTVRAHGTDLVVVFDLSRSMEAQDVDPSRLERARREIADLGRVREQDRIGLVLFAGGAYPRLPLTADFKALQLVLSEASTDTFDTQGSDLGGAIRAALALLERTRQDAGQALIVLSDGESHDPDDARAAAAEAAARGIPIFAMGIGVEPAPIPMRDGRYLEWQGERVLTAPDFEILKEVARLTGGAFVSSTASSQDMEQLYAEVRRSVSAAERSTQQRETWRSAFQWPLAASVFLLLFSGWLGEGRRPFGAAAAFLLGVQLLHGGAAYAADPLLDADRAYREGRYPQAIQELVDLSLLHPDDPEIFERLGAARYRAGDFEASARAFDEASALRGDAAVDDVFNSGNAHYRAGRLEDAQIRYEDVLSRSPDHEGARQNHDLVGKEIELRRAAKPPPPPPKPGEGEQDGESGESEEPKPAQGQNEGENESQGGGPSGEGAPQDAQGADSETGGPGNEKTEQGQDPKGTGRDSSDAPPDSPGTSGAVDPSQVQDGTAGGDPTEAGPGAPGGDPVADGPITAGQADRLLEGVEEGSQRVSVQGRPEGRPW